MSTVNAISGPGEASSPAPVPASFRLKIRRLGRGFHKLALAQVPLPQLIGRLKYRLAAVVPDSFGDLGRFDYFPRGAVDLRGCVLGKSSSSPNDRGALIRHLRIARFGERRYGRKL